MFLFVVCYNNKLLPIWGIRWVCYQVVFSGVYFHHHGQQHAIDMSADIIVNGQMLEEVTSFKWLGASLSSDGICSADSHIRIAQRWPD